MESTTSYWFVFTVDSGCFNERTVFVCSRLLLYFRLIFLCIVSFYFIALHYNKPGLYAY